MGCRMYCEAACWPTSAGFGAWIVFLEIGFDLTACCHSFTSRPFKVVLLLVSEEVVIMYFDAVILLGRRGSATSNVHHKDSTGSKEKYNRAELHYIAGIEESKCWWIKGHQGMKTNKVISD